MLTRRRLLIALPLLALLLAGGYSAWVVWQVRDDLADARAAADRLRAAIREQDTEARQAAASDLQLAASSADGRTDGPWWSALTWAPLLGDDAEAVRALSSSLDIAASDGVEPMSRVLDLLPRLDGDGRQDGIDLRVLARLRSPVTDAHAAMKQAGDEVAGTDTDNLAGPLRGPFEEYAEVVSDAESALASSVTATRVLPTMLGGEGARRYLLVFQNNAEIRATGGLPGSWAVVEASNGSLSMPKQGAGASFGETEEPVLPLSEAERKVFGPQLGTYFLDANFTPDFPRAAQLWTARWDQVYPDLPLDGVLSLDPVALSYLVEGTGPISVGDDSLDQATLVEALLSSPYIELDPVAQDARFALVARSIFDAVAGDLADPLAFVTGLSRAAAEGRFSVATFDEREAEELAGSSVLGALSGDSGSSPHVDIGLNDATGSKMSYYLRYYADVTSQGCIDGIQSLDGSLTLRQSISPEEARELPDSVTGSGEYGTERGSQLVLVRIHAPYEGSFGKITLDGRRIDRDVEVVDLDGRPVATMVVLLSSTEEAVVNWAMKSGPDQTGDGVLTLTPSVVSGDDDETFADSC